MGEILADAGLLREDAGDRGGDRRAEGAEGEVPLDAGVDLGQSGEDWSSRRERFRNVRSGALVIRYHRAREDELRGFPGSGAGGLCLGDDGLPGGRVLRRRCGREGDLDLRLGGYAQMGVRLVDEQPVHRVAEMIDRLADAGGCGITQDAHAPHALPGQWPRSEMQHMARQVDLVGIGI